jgi:hypothetical protein
MGTFEYVMVLVSIIIGLALTHILSALGAAVHRLRGCLFLIAVILIPDRMDGMRDSDEYFIAGRKWFFWAVLVGIGFDIADTFIKGVEWGTRPLNLGVNGVLIVACFFGIATERRRVQLATAATAFTVQLASVFWALPSLGQG